MGPLITASRVTGRLNLKNNHMKGLIELIKKYLGLTPKVEAPKPAPVAEVKPIEVAAPAPAPAPKKEYKKPEHMIPLEEVPAAPKKKKRYYKPKTKA